MSEINGLGGTIEFFQETCIYPLSDLHWASSSTRSWYTKGVQPLLQSQTRSSFLGVNRHTAWLPCSFPQHGLTFSLGYLWGSPFLPLKRSRRTDYGRENSHNFVLYTLLLPVKVWDPKYLKSSASGSPVDLFLFLTHTWEYKIKTAVTSGSGKALRLIIQRQVFTEYYVPGPV